MPKNAKELVFLDGPVVPQLITTSTILELNVQSQMRSSVQVLECESLCLSSGRVSNDTHTVFWWPLIQVVQLLALVDALQPLTPIKDIEAQSCYGAVPTLAITHPDENTPATYNIQSALSRVKRGRSRTRRSSRSAKAGSFKRESRDGFLCLPV